MVVRSASSAACASSMPAEQQIDRCGELQRAELDRGLTARVLEFERAAEGVAVEPIVLDELDVCAKGERHLPSAGLILRRRGELLGPAGVWQGAREVGHRQQREAEIRLELRHAAGFGAGLPDRVLQKIDRRREALAEGDLSDQAVRRARTADLASRRGPPRQARSPGRCCRRARDARPPEGVARARARSHRAASAPRHAPRAPQRTPALPSDAFVPPRREGAGPARITIAGCKLGMQRLLIRVGDPLREPAMHVGAARRRRPRIHRSGKQRVGKPDPVVSVECHETGSDGRFEMAGVHELRGRAGQAAHWSRASRVVSGSCSTRPRTSPATVSGIAPPKSAGSCPSRVEARRSRAHDRVATREGLDAGELVPRQGNIRAARRSAGRGSPWTAA